MPSLSLTSLVNSNACMQVMQDVSNLHGLAQQDPANNILTYSDGAAPEKAKSLVKMKVVVVVVVVVVAVGGGSGVVVVYGVAVTSLNI